MQGRGYFYMRIIDRRFICSTTRDTGFASGEGRRLIRCITPRLDAHRALILYWIIFTELSTIRNYENIHACGRGTVQMYFSSRC
jgi:hypothetical protein